MNADSMAVNKISMEELKTAPDFKIVIEEFHKRFCEGGSIPTILGWNVWFDVAFLRGLYEKMGKPWPFGHRFLDLQSVAQFFSGFQGVSLEKLVDSLLKEKPTHRAIDDTRHTAKVFKIFAEKYLTSTSPSL
jgi:DNA polymerase III alpha subunit (gram-positive type)